MTLDNRQQPNAQKTEVAEQLGQTVVDETVEQVDPGSEKNTHEAGHTKVAGYEPADLLKAPFQPPQSVEKEGKKATSNKVVKLVIFLGLIVVVIGIIFFFINLGLSVLLLLAGAVLVIIGVYAPIGYHKSAKS